MFVLLLGIVLGIAYVVLVAAVRALFLCWPVMLLLGALHASLAVVPALGLGATFILIMLVSLLLPLGNRPGGVKDIKKAFDEA